MDPSNYLSAQLEIESIANKSLAHLDYAETKIKELQLGIESLQHALNSMKEMLDNPNSPDQES